MIQFQENDWTDRSTERRMEGCTDPILWDPSGYRRGSKKNPDENKFYCGHLEI